VIAAVPSSPVSAEQEATLPTFAETVETHKAMVYSILWHFLRDRSLAEELAQEVFLELHQSWKSVKSPRHLVFWLRRVTTHRAIDLVRKRKIRPETSLEESGEPTVLEQVHDSFLASYLGRMGLPSGEAANARGASLPRRDGTGRNRPGVRHERKHRENSDWPGARIASGENNASAEAKGRMKGKR
jgi:RNA polymerase sigma factor (sigma-70 family)